MSKENEKNKTVVRAFISKDVKNEAVTYLKSIDVSQSEVIQQLFQYIAEYKQIPFQQVLKVNKTK